MKRTAIVLSLIGAALLAGGALGFQAKKAPKPKPVTEVTCPVMKKNKVNIAKATKAKLFADHKGRRYFFCCAGCPQAFKANPEAYKGAPSIPTPKKPTS